LDTRQVVAAKPESTASSQTEVRELFRAARLEGLEPSNNLFGDSRVALFVIMFTCIETCIMMEMMKGTKFPCLGRIEKGGNKKFIKNIVSWLLEEK